MARLGQIKRLPDFHQYLECYLEQLTTSELPFMNSAYAATNWHPPDSKGEAPPAGFFLSPEFVAVVQDWNAWLFLPAQRRGSLAQGSAWLRAIEETYAMPELGCLRSALLDHTLPTHFLMVLSASLRLVGISLEASQNLLIHIALRDQLGAAVRLGLLGSLQAQKLHYQFIGIGDDYRRQHKDWTYNLAHRTTPMLEIAQTGHANLYSKLFQS
jgi:urease accessory protein